MEAKLFWKSVIRRRGSLLFLMILVITASFGFMLRTVEYLAVSREIERISQEYQPVGTLSSPDGIVTEGAPLVEESPYVEFIDINRACPAILSDVYNVDLDGASCSGERGFDGLCISEWMAWGEVMGEVETDIPKTNSYIFRIKEGVYGYPEYIEPGKTLILETEIGEKVPQMEKGKTYLVRGYYPANVNDGYVGDMMTVRLQLLEEGTWFLEGEPDEEISGKYMDEDVMLQERNRHAMVAYATVDMSCLPQVQENSKDFYLEEGRWLNQRDQEEGQMVCVVMKEFADIRGLSVGDTLTMTLQDKDLYYMGYSAGGGDTWETDDKTEVTLEIVGIYGRLYGGLASSPSWAALTARNNFLYLPDRCMPEHYAKDSDIWQDSFSFVLNDPEEKEVFLAELTDKLAPLGISVSFVENNWDTFYPSAKAIRQGAFHSFLLFTIVLALVLGTVAFLYTWQRKKETAIARAVGVPAKRTAFCACLPMMAFGAAGILAGGILGWKYGLVQAGKTLAAVDADSRAELPIFWLVGICLSVWLLLTVILLAWNLVYARKPVLEILQGGVAGRRKKRIGAGNPRELKENEKIDAFKEKEADREPDVFGEQAARRTEKVLSRDCNAAIVKKMSVTAALRFTGRHLGRFSLRTASALLVAAVFTTASCCLWESIQTGEKEVDRLYRSNIVEMEIVKKNTSTAVSGHGGAYIKDRTVQELLDTGNILESYLVAGAEGEIVRMSNEDWEEWGKTNFIGIADMEQYLSKPGNGIEIHYRDGFGAELFEKDYTIKDRYGGLLYRPIVILPEEIWTQWEDDLRDNFSIKIADVGVTVDIGGFYIDAAGGVNDSASLLPMTVLKLLEEENLYYMTAQFTLDPEKNRELETFRQKSQEIIEAPRAALQPPSLVVWDIELKQAVEPMEKNISLMKILYPIANAVAFLAAVGLSVLFLFQRRREAAILRVLGVGMFSTRFILALELLVVNTAGILLGAVGTAILTENGLSAMPFAAGCYFLGCLIGTAAGVAMITKGRPLELLQDRE